MSEHRKVFKAAGLIGIITLLSRLTGLLRDSILAALFGATRINGVFLTAFELSNLLRRVLGEGALSSFIVPILSQRRLKDGEEAGWRFFNIALNFMLVATVILTLIGMFFSRQVFMAFGGAGLLKGREYEYIELGARLTRLMFPYMIGLTLASIMMGACHTLRRFGAASFGSVMLNLAMIAAAALALWIIPASELAAKKLSPGQIRAAVWLGWAVLAGVALRGLIMVPTLRRHGWRWSPVFSWRDPHLRGLLKVMVPGALALGISQINISVAGFFAMCLDAGVKPYIVTAGRLIQFPMALTATATATAMLPLMSQYLHEGRHDDLRALLAPSKRLEIVFMMPAMVGLMVLGLPIIRMLFEHGQWTPVDSVRANWALLCYAPGLLPLGWSRLLEPIFYARGDRVTPLKAAAVSMLVNVALNVIFVFYTHLNQAGLALANTIAAFAYYYALVCWTGRIMERPMGDRPRVGETIWKCLAASAAACAVGALIYWGLGRGLGAPRGTLMRAAYLFPVMGAIALLYFALVRLLRVPDSERAANMILRKLRPRPTQAGPDQS